MIELVAGFPDNVLGFAYKGHVTKADYDTVLVPAVMKALETQKSLRLYFVVEPDFAGIDVGAAWEDLKLGIGHRANWERVAVVTDVHWMEQMSRFYGLFVHGPMKTFAIADAVLARAWITAVN